jgi:UDP-N-acetyl-D-mannosaminuronate dehydrogenase
LRHIIVGRGEVGVAIEKCLHLQGANVGWVDLKRDLDCQCTFLHICIPWSDTFCDTVVERAEKHRPTACIIHSTVVPGTTNDIYGRTTVLVAYSPVRGRHGQDEQMVRDLLEFTKFVGSPSAEASRIAAAGLLECGFTVKVASSATVLELAKLFQTTYTGILVAWAQEMNRLCDELGVDYVESQALNEMPNLPHVIHQPGFIGGHCIIPNTFILDQVGESLFTEVVRMSNQLETNRPSNRLWPVPYRQSR